MLFGYTRNASSMLDAATQFDFYAGGGLGIAFLSFGKFDEVGNVNDSRLGDLTVGLGGFIDIAQNARKVMFCGTPGRQGREATNRRRPDARVAAKRGEKARQKSRADHL